MVNTLLHTPPVGHADDEDVVELVDAVNLGEELIDHSVVDAGAARHGAPRLWKVHLSSLIALGSDLSPTLT